MTAKIVQQELKKISSTKKAKASQWFFKTGPGQYGENDIFIGVTVPEQRQIAKKYKALPLKEVEKLLQSPVHEHRLTALFIMILQYQKASDPAKQALVKLYIKNIRHINNWDLVDTSAPKILGDYMLHTPRTQLYTWAKSKNIWERRIAILTTQAFIRNHDFTDTLAIAELLLNDTHDLIHKAVGWMLREVGNKDQVVEENFLKKYYTTMPRTMLRYAIEKFPPIIRQRYLVKA